MDNYFIKRETLEEIGDEIRTIQGTTELMYPSEMISNLKEANSEVDAQSDLIAQIHAALEEKAAGSGVELPTLTNPGTADDMAEGKELIDANGTVVTGSVEAVDSGSANAYYDEQLRSINVNGALRIGFSHVFDGAKLFRPGSRIASFTPVANFGDATAADVTKGKTFTSVSGLLVEGTHECEAGVELPTLETPGSASDLAAGKQLIDANGNVVTGTVSVLQGKTISNVSNVSLTGGDVRVYQDNAFTGRTIMENGSYVSMYVKPDKFGDATAADVATGKTFTSAAGFKVTGTANVGGLDTSDANVTASDLANGVIAYGSNGKVVGNLPVSNLGITYSGTPTVSFSNNAISMDVKNTARRIIEKDTSITMILGASNFGNATAADVAAGKTFTSSSGLKVTGTNTGGSGGSSTGMVMKSGSVSLDATSESLIIETGLSSVNCIMIYHEQPTNTSSTYGWDMSFDANIGKVLYRSYGQYLSYNYGVNSTNGVTASGGTVTASQYSSSYPVISGDFNWVAYGYK